jgi:thiamine-monophosphate kinase
MGSEFELIRRHFTHPVRHTLLGVGDDAALIATTAGLVLAVSTDMLVAGRHFLSDTDPERLGHKALAVNLSDLAAMGAKPRWALLALALPRADEPWLAAFARGFLAEAQAHDVDWVGGDTTAGPLNLSVTILGEVAPALALRRSGARVDDAIWVSGTLGDAALGLAALQGRYPLDSVARAHCIGRLERPTPRVALGGRLGGLAHAAIDLSDGLLADLGHLLEASGLGAELQFAALPRSPALAGLPNDDQVSDALLAGGDDYELCFTARAADRAAVEAVGRDTGTPLRCIGQVSADRGIRVFAADGSLLSPRRSGYDHFGGQAQQ